MGPVEKVTQMEAEEKKERRVMEPQKAPQMGLRESGSPKAPEVKVLRMEFGEREPRMESEEKVLLTEQRETEQQMEPVEKGTLRGPLETVLRRQEMESLRGLPRRVLK